jgi:hypothetical protein
MLLYLLLYFCELWANYIYIYIYILYILNIYTIYIYIYYIYMPNILVNHSSLPVEARLICVAVLRRDVYI